MNIACLKFKGESNGGRGNWKAGRIKGRVKTPEGKGMQNECREDEEEEDKGMQASQIKRFN